MEQEFLFGCGECSGVPVCMPAARRAGCVEMLLVTRGAVMVQTAMSVYKAIAGDIVFIAPDMVRAVTSNEGQAAVRYLYFSIGLFDGVTESVERDLLYMFLTQLRTKDNRVRRDSMMYDAVRRAMDACYEEYLSKELCYSLRIRGHLCMMMSELLASYSIRRENDRMIYHNVLRLRPTLQYISAHYRERITVPDLAERILVTPDYYTKLFRDSIGKTTIDYINCERVNRGMILLLETDMSIADVAEEIGLGSGNYFSKLFKTIVGTTPLAFRKSTE